MRRRAGPRIDFGRPVRGSGLLDRWCLAKLVVGGRSRYGDFFVVEDVRGLEVIRRQKNRR
jgi:hypothetical protein